MADANHDEPDVPGLPEIQDEAADTPMWVPALGLALLAAFVLSFVLRAAIAESDETVADEAAEAAEPEAEAEDAEEAAE